MDLKSNLQKPIFIRGCNRYGKYARGDLVRVDHIANTYVSQDTSEGVIVARMIGGNQCLLKVEDLEAAIQII